MRKHPLLLCALLLPFLGCGDAPALDEARLAERESAYRRACVSRALVETAVDDRETLEESFLAARDPSDPLGEVTRHAAVAALEFNRAYIDHAELRATALAYLDSAFRAAPTPADSLRYLRHSAAFAITLPQEGTIEANVLSSYQANFNAVLADEDHPCNWDFPF